MSNYFYTTNGNYTTSDIYTHYSIDTPHVRNIETFSNSLSTKTIEYTEIIMNELRTRALATKALEIHALAKKALETQTLSTQIILTVPAVEERRMKALNTYRLSPSPEKQSTVSSTSIEASNLYSEIFKKQMIATTATLALAQSEQSEQAMWTSQASYMILINGVDEKQREWLNADYKASQAQAQASEKTYVLQAYQAFQTTIVSLVEQAQAIQSALIKVNQATETQATQTQTAHAQALTQTQALAQTRKQEHALTQTQALAQAPALAQPLAQAQAQSTQALAVHALALEALEIQTQAIKATQVVQSIQVQITQLKTRGQAILTKTVKPTSEDSFFKIGLEIIVAEETLSVSQKKAFLTQQEATLLMQTLARQTTQTPQTPQSIQITQALQASQLALIKATITNDTTIKFDLVKKQQTQADYQVQVKQAFEAVQAAQVEQVTQAQASQSALTQVVQITQAQVIQTQTALTQVTQAIQAQAIQAQATQATQTRVPSTQARVPSTQTRVPTSSQVSTIPILYIAISCIGFILCCIVIYYVLFKSNNSDESDESDDKKN